MMQAATAVNPPIIENIPEQLTERPQWVNWQLEERDDKYTKVPYSPLSFERASSTDLMTWAPFEDALAALVVANFDGIGFVFCSADPYSGIDLDKCRNPETGVVDAWAQKIIDSVSEGYVEASPSETGIHIIVRGVVRGGSVKKGCVEMYSRDRFFTMTGKTL